MPDGRTVIEQIETGLLYGWTREWVADEAGARTFASVAAAQHFCREKKLRGVQILQEEPGGKLMAYPVVGQ